MLGLIEEEQAGELAIKAFFLVAHARKQLRLEALVEAIASADHNNRLDWSTTFVNPRKLLGVCRALLYSKKMSGSETGSRTEKPEANVNPQSELIDFCHYTVLV
jgi:hypothetical protein